MINHLQKFLHNNGVTQNRIAMRKFLKNSNIKKYQLHFYNKLMDNSMGKVVKLFNSWKGLPLLRDGD